MIIRVEHHHYFHGDPETNTTLRQILSALQTLTSEIMKMSELTDAVAALIAEVADSTTKLDSIRTFIEGVPALVQTAVAEALANANVEATAAAAAVAEATAAVSGKVDETLAAIDANTGEPPLGEETTSG